LLSVILKIRLKDLKNIYLHRQLNDVILNAFLALLEVTTIYNVYNLYLSHIKFANLFILLLGHNRSKILHSCQQDIPKWLPKIRVISSFFYTKFLKVYR
jgi:Ulp1 family protease